MSEEITVELMLVLRKTNYSKEMSRLPKKCFSLPWKPLFNPQVNIKSLRQLVWRFCKKMERNKKQRVIGFLDHFYMLISYRCHQ